jgi:hypothetical protein
MPPATARTPLLTLALAAAALAGCAALGDPLGRRDQLEELQLRYTQALRWGEVEDASEFVDPSLRASFAERAAALERFRISDYDIGKIRFENDDERATVVVTYRGYALASLVERSIRETQEWSREDGEWTVRPRFDGVIGPIEARSEGASGSVPAAPAPR